MVVKVHVGNLPDNCNGDSLREIFSKHGEVEDVHVIKNYAFVKMPSETAANEAIKELNGTKLLGMSITVQHAKPPKSGDDNKLRNNRRDSRDNNRDSRDNRRDNRGGNNRRNMTTPYNRNQMNNMPPIDPQLQQLGGILGAAPMLLNELSKVQQFQQQQQQQQQQQLQEQQQHTNKPDPDIRVRREVVNVRNVPGAEKQGFTSGYVIHERYYVLPSHPLLNELNLSQIPTLGQTNCSRTR